jgi:drug/metabolite transporter (DMT)-like permease
MADLPELVRIIVPAVIIPIGVFAGNWAIRYRSEYAQTAASDFLLAVIIFDGAVIAAAKDFEPFVHHPELRQIALQAHIVFGFVSAAIWWLIATFAEPLVASYYSRRRDRPTTPKFAVTLMICWMAVFILICAHVGFFIVQGHAHG